MSQISTSAPQLRRAGRLALFAAVYTYALIVFGGIVRITGSGMGCGTHWPKCNGVWIPQFTFETLIEYMHRALAAGIGTVMLVVLLYAVLHRRKPGFSGPGGVLRPLGVGAVLLVVQALLGAITVKLDLPHEVVIVHFLTAQIFVATLLTAAVRAGLFGGTGAARPDAAKQARVALMTAVFGFVVLTFGALTANTPGAPAACTGFPLCSGRLLPMADAPIVHIHWTHRVVAILFFLHLIGVFVRTRSATPAIRRASAATLGLVVLQITVAAGLVLMSLPASMRALHLAVGAAIWFSLVIWTAQTRKEAANAHMTVPVRAASGQRDSAVQA